MLQKALERYISEWKKRNNVFSMFVCYTSNFIGNPITSLTLLYSSLYLKCTLWHFLARYFIEYGLAKSPNFICSGINQSLSSNILSDIWKPVWRGDWFVSPLKTESEFSVFVVRWAIFLSFFHSQRYGQLALTNIIWF